jgi:hypothetical protein
MSEFFGRLETELRAAAERPPRRAVPVPAIAVAVLLALALAPIVLVLGSGSDDPTPERIAADDAPQAPAVAVHHRGVRYRPADATVVATGVAPVSGPWQLETFEDDAGQCLGVFRPEANLEREISYSAICPGSRDQPLPDFAAQAMATPSIPRQEEYLVFGRTPEEAAAVELTADGEVVERVETSEGPDGVSSDFYVMVLSPDPKRDGWMEWLDESGNPGEGVPFRLP